MSACLDDGSEPFDNSHPMALHVTMHSRHTLGLLSDCTIDGRMCKHVDFFYSTGTHEGTKYLWKTCERCHQRFDEQVMEDV